VVHYPPNVGVWVAVAVGGALGTLARAALDPGVLTGVAPDLWVTLLVNITGASLLGIATGHGLTRLSPVFQAAITTGFLGSFTTFSGILAVWLSLTLTSEALLGIAYLGATGVGGILAAYGGVEAGRWWQKVTTPGDKTPEGG